jgi:hypothetical protein
LDLEVLRTGDERTELGQTRAAASTNADQKRIASLQLQNSADPAEMLQRHFKEHEVHLMRRLFVIVDDEVLRRVGQAVYVLYRLVELLPGVQQTEERAKYDLLFDEDVVVLDRPEELLVQDLHQVHAEDLAITVICQSVVEHPSCLMNPESNDDLTVRREFGVDQHHALEHLGHIT